MRSMSGGGQFSNTTPPRIAFGNPTLPFQGRVKKRWRKHFADRDRLERAARQAEHQAAHAIECLERAGEFAIREAHTNIPSDARRMREPFGADRGEAGAAVPLCQARNHRAR